MPTPEKCRQGAISVSDQTALTNRGPKLPEKSCACFLASCLWQIKWHKVLFMFDLKVIHMFFNRHFFLKNTSGYKRRVKCHRGSQRLREHGVCCHSRGIYSLEFGKKLCVLSTSVSLCGISLYCAFSQFFSLYPSLPPKFLPMPYRCSTHRRCRRYWP